MLLPPAALARQSQFRWPGPAWALHWWVQGLLALPVLLALQPRPEWVAQPERWLVWQVLLVPRPLHWLASREVSSQVWVQVWVLVRMPPLVSGRSLTQGQAQGPLSVQGSPSEPMWVPVRAWLALALPQLQAPPQLPELAPVPVPGWLRVPV